MENASNDDLIKIPNHYIQLHIYSFSYDRIWRLKTVISFLWLRMEVGKIHTKHGVKLVKYSTLRRAENWDPPHRFRVSCLQPLSSSPILCWSHNLTQVGKFQLLIPPQLHEELDYLLHGILWGSSELIII